MHTPSFIRKTWLPTGLFFLVSTTVWWALLDLQEALRQGIPTLIVAPLIWWLMLGRRYPPGKFRGVMSGALIGFVSQLVPHVMWIWPFIAHRGQGDGDTQLAAWAEGMVYMTLAGAGLIVGAVLGLVAAVLQKRLDKPESGSVSGHMQAASL